VTALTDVYSLGAVMYEMLTQKKPFQSNDIDKLLQMIAHKNPRPPHLVDARVSEKLSQIVMKAMQKNPAMRFANATEMANAIQKLIERDERLKRKGNKQRQNADTPDNTSAGETSVVFWFYCAVRVLAVVLVAFAIKH
jgi:serine/threonine-protein kinase